MSAWINCMRAGLYAILAWVSFCVCTLTFSVTWKENHEPGSHLHYTWPASDWGTRLMWTMVRRAAGCCCLLVAVSRRPFALCPACSRLAAGDAVTP